MTFGEARSHVVESLHYVAGAKNDPRFARMLANPSEDLQFEDMELDSLAAMGVCLEIETRTDIPIDLADLVAHPSLNQLAEALVIRSTKQ